MATVVFPSVGNAGITRLSSAINASVTTVNVDSATALTLDNSTTDAYIVVIDASTYRNSPIITPETSEIMKVTEVATNALTVVRGQDGSSAKAFSDNDIVELRVVAATIERIYDALTDGNDDLNIGEITASGGNVNIPLDNGRVYLTRTAGAGSGSAELKLSNTSDLFLTNITNVGGSSVYIETRNGTYSWEFDSSGDATFGGDLSVGGDLTLGGILNLGAAQLVTVASGAITVIGSNLKVAGEGGSADSISSIAGGSDGDIVYFRAADDAVTITFNDTGNIQLNGARVLDSEFDTLVLQFVVGGTANRWVEVSFSDNV